jgi:hypothetical protein
VGDAQAAPHGRRHAKPDLDYKRLIGITSREIRPAGTARLSGPGRRCRP